MNKRMDGHSLIMIGHGWMNQCVNGMYQWMDHGRVRDERMDGCVTEGNVPSKLCACAGRETSAHKKPWSAHK